MKHFLSVLPECSVLVEQHTVKSATYWSVSTAALELGLGITWGASKNSSHLPATSQTNQTRISWSRTQAMGFLKLPRTFLGKICREGRKPAAVLQCELFQGKHLAQI